MVSLGGPILYHLSDGNEDPERSLRIRLIAGSSGSVNQVRFGVGDGGDREFSGSDIRTVAEAGGIRASFVLEAGTETSSRRSFEVIVPVVVVGPEPPDQGPFGVFAVGIRIEEFPISDDASAGPRQEFEPIVLTGRAIAHDPQLDAPASE
jgi:hypothetical protein